MGDKHNGDIRLPMTMHATAEKYANMAYALCLTKCTARTTYDISQKRDYEYNEYYCVARQCQQQGRN